MKNKFYLILVGFFESLGYKLIIKKIKGNSNAIVNNKIGDFDMLMNKEHIYNHPYLYEQYGKNLIRLAKLINHKYPKTTIIDIGANIGDTVALLRTELENKIICFEGDSFYLGLLHENMRQFNAIVIYEQFLGDSDKLMLLKLTHNQGTLKLESEHKGSSKSISIKKLDSFYKNEPKLFSNVKLMKTDTDGFDNSILIGSEVFISDNQPIIFFEYSEMHLTNNGIEAIEIFDYLEKLGYQYLMFFEPHGRFIISCEISQKEIINQIHCFISNYSLPLEFLDIVAFTHNDFDLFNQSVKDELSLNMISNNNKINKN